MKHNDPSGSHCVPPLGGFHCVVLSCECAVECGSWSVWTLCVLAFDSMAKCWYDRNSISWSGRSGASWRWISDVQTMRERALVIKWHQADATEISGCTSNAGIAKKTQRETTETPPESREKTMRTANRWTVMTQERMELDQIQKQ